VVRSVLWTIVFKSFLLSVLAYGGSKKDFIPLGLEFEFASERFLEAKIEAVPREGYIKLLEIVREALDDSDGKIKILPWDRYVERNPVYAYYKDTKGRGWKAVPEAVNTSGLDGFELVTPRLLSLEDLHEAKKVYRAVLESKEYGPGIRSSVHATFDVSHLIDEDGNISRLVNTILFVENHWPEVYAAISPKRYGALINRFSVPLALEHQKLLTNLSTLPTNERTKSKVKSLFESAYLRELEVKNFDARKAWKYRAANYGRLFGLIPGQERPTIEFRLLDLNHPDDLFRKIHFLQRLMKVGGDLAENPKFLNPFGDRQYEHGESSLDEFLYSLSLQKYEKFLENLGLQMSDYPMFHSLQDPPVYGYSDSEERLRVPFLDFSDELSFNGAPITFGFEVEMKGPRVMNILTEDKKGVHLEKFPFLDGSVDRESITGNYEVRSTPSRYFSEVVSNMELIRNALGGDIRSFHLHIRAPKALTDQIPQEELKGWVSRLGDYVYSWRLQNRHHIYALRAKSMKRRAPDFIYEKGTLMVREIGDSMDFEIRGFMNDVEKLKRTTERMMTALFFPQYLHGFYDHQNMLHHQEYDLLEVMQEFISKYYSRELTPEEVDLLRDVGSYATKNGVLPLFGFEYAPFLTDLQRIKIQNANFRFKKGVKIVLENVTEKKRYERQTKDLYKQFRWRVKRWAQEIDLHRMLDRSILLPPDFEEKKIKTHREIEKFMRASSSPEADRYAARSAERLVELLPDEQRVDWMTQALDGESEKLRRIALSRLLNANFNVDIDPQLRRTAQRILLQSLEEESTPTRSCESLLSSNENH
jgi:hypothetical protein